MMAQLINRRQVKAESRLLLQQATVTPLHMVALFYFLQLVLNLLDAFSNTLETSPVGMFVTILTSLMGLVLSAGFILYCMTIRRNEHAEFLTLFDGFSLVGKLISLYILEMFFVFLWSFLFLIPGIVAMYRYRFAMYNLLENPELRRMQALELSKRQTMGYKMQCFQLDLSYAGWVILTILPIYLVNLAITMDMFGMEVPTMLQTLSNLSPVVIAAVFSAWNLLLAVFYYANMTCSDLEYHEIAQTTSGYTAFSDPSQNSAPTL